MRVWKNKVPNKADRPQPLRDLCADATLVDSRLRSTFQRAEGACVRVALSQGKCLPLQRQWQACGSASHQPGASPLSRISNLSVALSPFPFATAQICTVQKTREVHCFLIVNVSPMPSATLRTKEIHYLLRLAGKMAQSLRSHLWEAWDSFLSPHEICPPSQGKMKKTISLELRILRTTLKKNNAGRLPLPYFNP